MQPVVAQYEEHAIRHRLRSEVPGISFGREVGLADAAPFTNSLPRRISQVSPSRATTRLMKSSSSGRATPIPPQPVEEPADHAAILVGRRVGIGEHHHVPVADIGEQRADPAPRIRSPGRASSSSTDRMKNAWTRKLLITSRISADATSGRSSRASAAGPCGDRSPRRPRRPARRVGGRWSQVQRRPSRTAPGRPPRPDPAWLRPRPAPPPRRRMHRRRLTRRRQTPHRRPRSRPAARRRRPRRAAVVPTLGGAGIELGAAQPPRGLHRPFLGELLDGLVLDRLERGQLRLVERSLIEAFFPRRSRR